MRRSITLGEIEARAKFRYKVFAGRLEWGRGLFVLFSVSIFATAALEVVLSLAAPYLAVHGRELTACLVGLLYDHFTGFNPIDFSDVLDLAHLAPPDILARWIYLPFLGLISLGLSLPTFTIRGFLNPTRRQVFAAGAALASLLYAALLLAYPVSAAFYGACPCQINWQASLGVMADLRWGYYLALGVAVVNVILNEFSTQIEAFPVPGQTPEDVRARALDHDAQLALDTGCWGDAIAKAELALTLPGNESNTNLLDILALAYAGAGNWEGARAAAQRALVLDPYRVDLWRVLARAQAELKQPDAALAALERARALAKPDDVPGLLAERRAILVGQQRWADALGTLDEELNLVPGDLERLTARVDLLRRLGHESEALGLARKLTARPDATFALWLARAELERIVANDDAEVQKALDAAEPLARGKPELVAALAEVRAKLLTAPVPPAPVAPAPIPPSLVAMGFAQQNIGGVTVILQPVPHPIVQAGPFQMGGPPGSTVHVARFSIAKFPVTVAEYEWFVQAERRTPPRDWARQRNHRDHPIVHVTWHDAMAYAAWLARITGQSWRLPTEAQWEKAACWVPATNTELEYPWGNAFNVTLCNTAESRIGTTTRVGTYPGGASPCGAQDMEGNVWEWTTSLNWKYPYLAGDGRETDPAGGNRVLRGGSWRSSWPEASTRFRGSDAPDHDREDVGFRLVM